MLAVARMPRPAPDVARRATAWSWSASTLADPGNAGTLLRSAEASGAAGIVLSDGSVDAYNPKVVRASAGAIFGVPVVEGWSAVEVLDASASGAGSGLGAVAAGGTPYDEVDFTRPDRDRARQRGPRAARRPRRPLDGRVTIPMAARAESLNVAMAGTVLCFESARQRARADA